MKEKKIEIGLLVQSKAGHDAGRYYMIINKTDENYVEIADGKIKTLEKPKKKKIRHLEFSQTRLDIEELRAKSLFHNKTVADFIKANAKTEE